MVTNHSLKTITRQLQSKQGITYLAALKLAQASKARVNDFARIEKLRITDPHIRQAAIALSEKVPVVIYGATGSGKTTLAHAVLSLMQGSKGFICNTVIETPDRAAYFDYDLMVTQKEVESDERLIPWIGSFDNLVLDEVRSASDAMTEVLLNAHTTPLIVLHAQSKRQAARRLTALGYSLENDAIFIRAEAIKNSDGVIRSSVLEL